jgi:outer membrane protein, multidrug efflux system
MSKWVCMRRATVLSSVLTSVLTATLIASGCSFMPEHSADASAAPAAWPAELWVHRPEVQRDSRQVSAGDTAITEAAAAPTTPPLPILSENSWRIFIQEPGLQKCVEAALEHNRSLARSLADVEQARAQSSALRSGLWPALDLHAQRSATHTPETVTSSGSSNFGSSNGFRQRYDANLQSAYELDFWGRVRSLDAAQRAQFLATDYAYRSYRITLIADVSNAWYAHADMQLREHLLTRIESARKTGLDLITQRRDVGLASDLDFTAARAAYHSARSERLAAARLRVQGENALRLFVGREPEPDWMPPAPTGDTVPPLPTFPQAAVGLPSEAILRRPDVRAAEQRLIAARANIGAARAAFLPRITLTATGGSASSELSDLFTSGSGAWAFTPLLVLPIFDAGRREAELDIAKAREHAAIADYELTVQRAFREIADALATTKYGWQAVLEVYVMADAQLARLKLVEARYEAGVANYLELLDAQREAMAAQLSQSAVRFGVQSSATAFFKAVGGL